LTTALITIGVVALLAVAVYLLGRKTEKAATSGKAASVARKQSKIASRPRKRRAKDVADSIDKRGL
jgi:hypothetical protein